MISINIYEIVMQMINFGVLIFLLNKFMYKPLISFLEGREKLIKDDLAEADRNKLETAESLKEQKDMLQSARVEAQEIRQKAEIASQSEREAVLTKSKEDSARLLANAKKEIQLDYERAKKTLVSDVGGLSVDLAQKIIKRNIDQKDQDIVLSEYVDLIKN